MTNFVPVEYKIASHMMATVNNVTMILFHANSILTPSGTKIVLIGTHQTPYRPVLKQLHSSAVYTERIQPTLTSIY